MRFYHSYDDLIANNILWAEEKKSVDAAYFTNLAEYQAPPFLYIGCSDSRVPLDLFTKTEPGEMFIHRNVANQVSLTDMNFLSVLEYAIEELKVKHIIVCGHYNCGGVMGAYFNNLRGLKENWCTPIKDLVIQHRMELLMIQDEQKRIDRLCELNVIQNVKNIFRVSSLERLIEANGYYPTVHGWLLNIRDGSIVDLDLPLEDWKKEGSIPRNYDPKSNLQP